MHSFLVKIASLAVMLHMALGCSWHHGFGAEGACVNHVATTSSHADIVHSDCSHVKHDEHRHSSDESKRDDSKRDSHQDHSGCQDDRCSVTQDARPEFDVTDLTVEYLGGIESASVTVASFTQAGDRLTRACDPFPDFCHSATGMRAHLLLGVLTL